MKRTGATVLLLAACLTSMAVAVPLELNGQLPQAALSGQATMRFFGFEIYRASLWVAPGFSDANYGQGRFALELRYLRNFRGSDIAKRSIVEMKRQDGFDANLAPQWEQQMSALFPNVQIGDRITGVHLPGVGAEFYGNGKLLGGIRDPLSARLFFGIWLSPQTSEPDLRKDLLTLGTGVAK